ncbi:MAG: PKD domain-containing protein, partial [Planctomycetes bacterium]|nr:PKD domain-containing protein [Planctomycetota bacterium]
MNWTRPKTEPHGPGPWDDIPMTSPVPGSTFKFVVNVAYEPDTVIFDFGDGRTGRPNRVEGDAFWAEHTYTKPGEFVIAVTAKNEAGTSSSPSGLTTRVKIWDVPSKASKPRSDSGTTQRSDRGSRD